jgi:hypothetical protein
MVENKLCEVTDLFYYLVKAYNQLKILKAGSERRTKLIVQFKILELSLNNVGKNS